MYFSTWHNATVEQRTIAYAAYNYAYHCTGNEAYNYANNMAQTQHNLPDDMLPVMGVMAQDAVMDTITQIVIYGQNAVICPIAMLPAWLDWYDTMVYHATQCLKDNS